MNIALKEFLTSLAFSLYSWIWLQTLFSFQTLKMSPMLWTMIFLRLLMSMCIVLGEQAVLETVVRPLAFMTQNLMHHWPNILWRFFSRLAEQILWYNNSLYWVTRIFNVHFNVLITQGFRDVKLCLWESGSWCFEGWFCFCLQPFEPEDEGSTVFWKHWLTLYQSTWHNIPEDLEHH